MSYGDVHIANDFRTLKGQGKTTEEAIQIIARRIRQRYPGMRLRDCELIATRVSQGKAGNWPEKRSTRTKHEKTLLDDLLP